MGNPYAPSTRAALGSGGRVVIGHPDAWELRVHGPKGPVERIIRAAIPRLPVTPELEEAGLERAREMAESSPLTVRQAEDAYGGIALPATSPPSRRSSPPGK